MNRIREARKAKYLTMKELGKNIGVSESAVSMYETGRREPDHATLVNISNVIGVSVDYLLCCTDIPDPAEEIKSQPMPAGDELDRRLVSMLMDLTPQEFQRVLDFVEGMKAARKV